MRIPLISRFRENKYPAEAWIIKPYKNDVDIEKDRARRIDEKSEKGDIVSNETRFELGRGGKTQPIPYKQIYSTNEDPVVILLSPERGTYLPADITMQDFTEILEEPKEYLEELQEKYDGEELQEKIDASKEDLEEKEEELEEIQPLQAQLDVAMENQEWLRWGKNTVMDLKLSWEEEGGWWDRHGSQVLVVIAAALLVIIGILNYMGQQQIAKAMEKVSKSLIPVAAVNLKHRFRR